MRQGTAPRHTFTLPFDTSDVKKVRVLYKQNDGLKIRKTEKDVQMDGNKIVVTLTQEDTFCLNPNYETRIQLRVLTKAGEPLVSDPFTVSTEECFNKEVL